MKLNAIILSLASLAAFPTLASAGVWSCADQAPCIEFTMKTKADTCGVGGECAVEVCMFISSGLNGCSKSDSFSHMCHQSDSNGCPDVSGGVPQMGIGGPDNQSCSAVSSFTGQDDTASFIGKCENGDDMLMCQEGKPGDTLYWILKDGRQPGNQNSLTVENESIDFTVDGCTQSVSCKSHDKYCAGNSNQAKYERTWGFTIPDGTGSCPSPCTANPGPTPTSGPTSAPTSGPSEAPVAAPITPNPPPITPNPPPVTPPTPTSENQPTPGSNGDPHFKTWANEHFEYHGQCDLVLTKDESFADGLGLDIQLRTKLVRYWSYIRSAAVRIGADIIELEGSADPQDQSIRYWYNMQLRSDEAKTMSGFPMTVRRVCNRVTKIEIDLSSKYPGVKIVMSTFREFVKVEVEGATEEAFGNSVGLLGDFKTGKTLARDGMKQMHDFIQYGHEWQVTPMEDMIFHSTEEPQFPSKCLEPEDPRGDRRRRLGESNITMEQAESACDRLNDPLDRKDCIYDILATQDLDMAGAF